MRSFHHRYRWFSSLIALVVCALPALPAAGQPAAAKQPPESAELKGVYVADAEQLRVKAGEKVDGWDWKLNNGATFSLGDNRNVIGQAPGTTVTLGIKFDGATVYNHGKHELRNQLSLGASLTRTTIVPEFIKSADTFSLDSIYLYRLIDWVGLFGRVALETQMFRSVDVRPADFTFQITRPDGTVEMVSGGEGDLHRLSLSEPFRPLLVKQSIGPFARLLEKENINLELRAGAGAHETVADNQLVLNDNVVLTPKIVEVRELFGVYQVGLEFVASVWGELSSKRVSYRAGVEVMVPVLHNDLLPQQLAAIEPGLMEQPPALALTNIDILAKLSVKLVEWASLDYEFKVKRQPQLLNEFQIQNNLLLTLGLTLNKKPPPAPAPAAASPAAVAPAAAPPAP
jgi:hypothetical protein